MPLVFSLHPMFFQAEADKGYTGGYRARYTGLKENPMPQLFDTATGAALGTITEEQLEFMMAQLEEEAAEDTDYYLNQATLDMFAENGADPALLELLRSALSGREEMDIRWTR